MLGQNLSNSLYQFWKDKSIPLQILHHYSVLQKITPLYFFKSSNIYVDKKEPINVKSFETSKCSGENLSNSSCQFWNKTSISLQILHHSSLSWKVNLLYFFISYNVYLAQKEPFKAKICENFECSGQNLSNFSCQFWNDTSIPLQILYHSSFS